MRKQIHFLAVLSATAMMAAVTPMVANVPGFLPAAFAASKAGWVQDGDELRYRDSDGYYLTDTWKKNEGDWYYLNEDGFITRSAMVDEYYVGEDGKRVSNQWVGKVNEDGWDEDQPEIYWYYYGSNGKQLVSSWATINNKDYYFNEEGYMETGKLQLGGFTYYLGSEDGAMRTGWVMLANEDEEADEEFVWHYFDNKGRMVMNEVDRKINGEYYTFEDGVMQTGWYKLPAVTTAAEATDETTAATEAPAIASYQYYEADGKRAEGWYQIEGVPEISEEGEIFTFYFKKGSPYHASTGVQTFNISSRRYGFNTRGEMQTGLQQVTLDDGSTANYYFGEDGVMRTGKQTIYDEESDANQTWYFITDGGSKGQGFHGIRDNNVYRNGLRLDADRDLRYAPVELDGTRYLVNASGSIQKASSSSKSASRPELGNGFKDVADTNDTIWTVNTSGVIQPAPEA